MHCLIPLLSRDGTSPLTAHADPSPVFLRCPNL